MVHALVIAVMGVAFRQTLAGDVFTNGLAGAETLQHALAFSNIVFAGAIAVWLANTLSSILRAAATCWRRRSR